MKLWRAWLKHAASDWTAAQALKGAGSDPCQIAAKYQQTVEKSVKGFAEALNLAALVTIVVGSDHAVGKHASAIQRAAHS